nr:thiamine-monophosphate kinase [Candidatus Aminicenantes bacterium]
MNVKNLGEFGLIEMIKKMVGTSSTVVQGIGDDCAVLPFDRNNFFLLTCDMLVEDEDFTRRDQPYWVGRKSLGCCLSDVAASGGKPVYAQVCLGLPSRITVNWVRWLYRGIISIGTEFGVKIVGGDLSRSDKLVIDISLTGLVERKNLVLRQGAKKGDIIFVSGELGGSIYPQTKGLGAGLHAKHLTFMPRV